MKAKMNRKTMMITISIAASLVVLSTALVSNLFANAAEPNKNVIQETPISAKTDLLGAEDEATKDLNIIVYTQGMEIPADAVTPQFAVASAAEIAERVYEKPFTEKVFATLCEDVDESSDGKAYWMIDGEVDGGILYVEINAKTGTDISARFFEWDGNKQWTEEEWNEATKEEKDRSEEQWKELARENWRDSFDNWDEEEAEKERKAWEKELGEMPEPPAEDVFSEEDHAKLMEMKRDANLDFAESMKDTPYPATAVKLVNDLRIAGDAKATSAAVMMGDADPGDCTYYVVEVTLDNGEYVELDLTVDDMEVLGYTLSKTDISSEY